ncbi:sel1 repeat family protein [Psychrobacter sp. Sarcosine-02u-2]|uniref:tetratricopeptide repeat protein n=1 Tax=Psychrobacter sp. Sarcosine-02u-2 TaxID=2058324 RepID=UPI000C7A1EDF|nr:SEL1-like repeat protein [Psychrobacter sp. Sarcosine-02u-2]PKG83964.1 sel1 repeat family protein [Psychrobacter sp. Sarcosine-02u-2]
MSASPLTPLDYIAAGYWQDFLAGRFVAGGMAYEAELHRCTLDESLASLQRVDTLLSQIRRDMVKSGSWDEAALLIDERYRNFMVFLAFYTGRVLAQQWQYTPHWFGEFELRKRYPTLPLLTDDFYQHMAVVYRDDSEVNNQFNTTESLFFALEPIGMRLFGHIDRAFQAVQGGQVASGLYQAVTARVPNAINNSYSHHELQSTPEPVKADTVLAKANLSTASLESPPVQTITAETTSVVSSQAALKEVAVKPTTKFAPTPELFTQLLIELDEIDVAQSAGKTEYEQARKVLDQFEQYIAKQEKPRAQVAFSQQHLAAKQQALARLQDAAHAGNSAAMLRLAMYELLGEGINTDKVAGMEAGVEWVKQAASKNDSRAQRLLSKLYYQGFGVPQDMTNGKYWLEQASENGHVEAASLVSQWQQAQALISTQKQEQYSLKRYQLLFAVIIVVAILIFIIV